jgi:hypothetical protein
MKILQSQGLTKKINGDRLKNNMRNAGIDLQGKAPRLIFLLQFINK